jgi:hypothetical protein
LIHVSLNQLSPYKALSYTWGVDAACSSINLDGTAVPVRENLENALKRLRHDTIYEPLLIWIDAININQQDNAEKSDQISKMRLIFERAAMVTVWIGSESSNSPLAFKLVRDLISCPKESLSVLITDPARVDQIEALRQLYYRDY